MAIIFNTDPVQGRMPVLSFLTFKGSLIFNALMTLNTTRKTRNTLLNLSDRELTDIGFTRGDVLRIASW